jgi:hypothetical protein
VRATVYVDDNVTKAPGESTLTTEVYLRNQNRPPIAAFSASPGKGTAISLDGGDSYDPEGGKLTFDWYDGATKVGSGAFFVYDGGAGTHTIKLTVTDPAGNVDTADPKTFTCTTSGGCIAS